MTVTILLTIACPALGLFAGYYCLTEKIFDWRSGAFCLAMFMAAIAYAYQPGESSDLIRYMEYVEEVGRLPLSEALKVGTYAAQNLWGFAIACWLIGKTGDPHILPFLSVLIVYYIGFYITGKIGESIEAKRELIALYMFFILLTSNFYAIVNNVRNVLSFAIIGLGIFREKYERKFDLFTIALYLLPLFIHTSAMALLVCRLLVPVTSKVRLAILILCVYIKQVITALDEITASLPQSVSVFAMINRTVHKAYRYFNDEDSSWGTAALRSGSRRLWKILYITLAFIMCVAAYYCTSYFKKKGKEIDAKKYSRLIFMVDFAFVLGLMTISCLPMRMPEYWRFAAVLILFGSPICFTYSMIEELKTEGDTEKTITITVDLLKKAVLMITVGCFLLWVRAISNSDIIRLITQPFVSSPIVVLFKSLFTKIEFYL